MMARGCKVTVVDCGPLTLDKGILMTGASGQVTIPSSVWVIEHPKHGVILFDTGVNYLVADPETAETHWGPGMREAFGCTLTREMAVDQQLIRLGYKLEDVKYVILSQMHLDHAGGMCHFPHATFVVQKDELRFAWWPDHFPGLVYCYNDYKDTRGFKYLQLTSDVDLFQDGTIQLIRTPGHTPGHQAMILRLEHRGLICLAADTSHLYEAYANNAPMPYDWNVEVLTDSYTRLRVLEQAGIPLFFSHDPEHFNELHGKWVD